MPCQIDACPRNKPPYLNGFGASFSSVFCQHLLDKTSILGQLIFMFLINADYGKIGFLYRIVRFPECCLDSFRCRT